MFNVDLVILVILELVGFGFVVSLLMEAVVLMTWHSSECYEYVNDMPLVW